MFNNACVPSPHFFIFDHELSMFSTAFILTLLVPFIELLCLCFKLGFLYSGFLHLGWCSTSHLSQLASWHLWVTKQHTWILIMTCWLKKKPDKKKSHAYCIISFIWHSKAREDKIKMTKIRIVYVCGVCRLT